jgi:hypothetical protein
MDKALAEYLHDLKFEEAHKKQLKDNKVGKNKVGDTSNKLKS